MDQYARAFAPSNHDGPLDDTDTIRAPVLEVAIKWGDQVLDVQHVGAPYSFVLETEREHPPPNTSGRFVLPEEALQKRAVTLVQQVGTDPVIALGELPPDCELWGTTWGPMTARELVAHARSQGHVYEDNAVWPLRHRVDLQGSENVTLRLGAFDLVIGVTNAAKPVPRVWFMHEGHELAYFASSFLSAAGLFAGAAFFAPPLGLTAAEGLSRNDLVLMQQYLDAAAEREKEREFDTGQSDQQAAAGESGQRAENIEGAMGDTQSTERNRRYQVKGPPDNPDPHLARTAMREEAATFGTIGILNSMLGGPNAPTAPWGRDEALGLDAESANGVMWANDIGSAFGAGGLGLSGVGQGGGGLYEGVGMSNVGTVFGGVGGTCDESTPCSGNETRFGAGHGRLPGTRRVKAPTVRSAFTIVSGRLPRETIQRVVRQNHGRFRVCYERALNANPSLEGRVSVRFVIGRDGAVSSVANAGSSLASGEAVSCVLRAFYGLSFPKPEGGLVTVTYPLSFSPG